LSIDYALFAPWAALAGGLLIGAACALYVLGLGRIAGIAGIVAGPLRCLFTAGTLAAETPRLMFIAGLLAAPWAWQLVAPLPPVESVSQPMLLVAAGLLVGLGVRMGNGCTSGHGVCGLSRLSLRSLVNVLAFMGAGFATVYVLRHLA
jgi:uncharacterized membrane protein YedE/YeeE